MGWYMDPLVYGDYPFVMKSLVRNALPKFSEEDKELVKGAYDFVGVNYYTSRNASTLPIDADDSPQSHDQYQYVDLKVDRSGKPIGELGLPLANRCCMCRGSAESVDHLLIHCPVAYSLWVHMLQAFGIQWVMPGSVECLVACWSNWLEKFSLDI
ncbi:furostanol glycoside 26-O-beta-glucosidase-like [Castanea sativa]|uniref:furostanol glycoside 26-O-beta-glucosidase-like n=1 Tax=Castanea sativa TaxID=21020 RepID=UPI003F64C7E4